MKNNLRNSYFLFFALVVSLLNVVTAKTAAVLPAHPKVHVAGLYGSDFGKRSCDVTMTGGTCVGSELSIVSSSPVASISWLLNGVSVFDQTNAKQNNGQIVAGGNGTGNAANQLYNPNRLFVDREGNLYIPDMANNRVQKWAPGATSGITIAGGNGTGSGQNQFNRPTAVTVDGAGNLYVVDQNNARVQKWAPGATAGITIATSLSTPTGICFDKQGNLYVSEQNGQRVVKFVNALAPGIVVAGGNGYGGSANQLAAPTGLFVDEDNNLYICDTDNYRVQKWAPGASTGITVARTSGNPLGVYVDGSKNIYVSDYTGYAVQKFTNGSTSGVTIAGGNGPGNSPNQIQPAGIYMDGYNNLYVTDFLNGRVIKFSNIYTGTYTTLKAGTYTAKVTTTDGCVAISNAIEIKDNVIPKISIAANKSVVCAAYQPTFTATIENGGSMPGLQWKVNNIDVIGEHASTYMPKALTAQDVVSCTLTSSELCATNREVFSNRIILNMPVTEVPTIVIKTAEGSTCSGSKVRFDAMVSNAGDSPTFSWKVNNVVQPGSDAFYETERLQNGDLISCTVISNAQYCQASTTASSNEIKVEINPILTPAVVISTGQTKIYSTSTVEFIASAVNGGTTPSYQWYINGVRSGENSNVFKTSNLKQGDEIYCQLTSTQACLTTNMVTSNVIIADVIVVITVKPPSSFTPNGDGINDFWEIDDLKSFPGCNVSVFNRYGLKVFQSVGYQVAWGGAYNGVHCPPGVYYYTIRLDQAQIISGSITIIK
ncbi:T9SS type B sorting domain-containing protein [Pedobacter sandarakinus]|uniref:T9SS type B sorting domain-containing protein n=1 Tax=Pedobacter sandarakinus TaxID=353156 RepID=UPI0022459CD5|nr:gliding motility-associated C-terminal domain-containing protein [Pedobacter sandarakinus]MCX2573376.1 gliding motility-associated C-terminal domain-containing protein [Pedobacter sandarakinus]